MTFLEIETRIKNAPPLDFGNLINDVIELFKNIWLKGFISVLLILVFALGIIFVFSLIGLAPQNLTFQETFELENFYNSYFLNVLYGIPQTILVSTVTLAVLAAFYRICRQFVLGETVEANYFYFFKKEYFSKVFMLGMIYTAIAAVAQLMFILPYLYVYIPLSFFAVVLANNPDMGELAIVKLSFKLGNKKWFITFITMLVAGIIGMLGIIACGIGVVLTISIAYLPSFLVYKEVVGWDESNEIDTIGTLD
ncbi:hypothetical protein [Xanthomarina sp.]|uniref:hypothetical protein n=1 Tax=Xanthomarina sp. TaxID=1931211 RepID=UPI002B6249F5|nr:hypothetical protein [Xanthomarina sp.]HLV38286.1 hypothetical protein [Xanthomarina sp.]